MDYTNAPGNVAGQFTDGDPGAGQPATVVDSLWLNGVQNELVKLIADSGLTPDAGQDIQIREALRRWVSSENQFFNANLAFDYGDIHAYPFAAGGRYVAAGWYLVSDGAMSITRASQDATGWLIEGTGNIGDTFFLRSDQHTYRQQNKPANLGITPQPRKVYTGAARAFTLGADGSVGVTMSVRPTTAATPLYTITTLDNTDALIGGGSDAQGLASIRYELENKLDQAYPSIPSAPEFVFTLEASGSFAIRLNGFGLWEGHVPDQFIPSCIVSDYVKDGAYHEAYFNDRRNFRMYFHQHQGWARRNGIGPWTNSFIDLWVPYLHPIPEAFTFPETRVFDVSGFVGGTAITNVNNAQCQIPSLASNSRGVHIQFNVDHGSISDVNDFYYQLNFSVQMQKGADYT